MTRSGAQHQPWGQGQAMGQDHAFSEELGSVGPQLAGPAVWYVLDPADGRPQMVGGSPADVLGIDGSLRDVLVRCVHPDDRGRVLAARLTAIDERRPMRIEYRIQPLRGGTPRWVLELMMVIRTSDGEMLEGVVIDTTAEHRAFDWVDKSLNEAEDEIDQLTRREEAKATFIRLLLHDFRPALTSCQDGLAAIEGGDVTAPTIGYLGNALRELVELLEGALEVDRFNGPVELQLRPLDLADMADVVVDRLASPRIVTQLHPAPTQGDAFLLERIVDNLLRNGLVHTPPETMITVRTWGDEAGVCLEVADQGGGVPSDRAEEIFEPFIRLGATDRPGLGMGLALVRNVALMHGGTCHVTETPGGGATFRVELPCLTAPPTTGRTRNAASLNGQGHLGTVDGLHTAPFRDVRP